LRWRIAVEAAILDADCFAEKPSRAGRVDDEAGAKTDGSPLTYTHEHRIARGLPVENLEFHQIFVVGAERDRLVDEKAVTSLRSQCVSDSSSLGLAATSSWFARSAAVR
jgi:hypothetical protein